MAEQPADGVPSRERAVDRYLELRPVIRAWQRATVPAEVRAGFGPVTGHQMRALASLPAAGLTMGQLANSLNITGVSGATASVLAGRLEAQGLARREQDENDRRIVRLVPSSRGLDLADHYRAMQRRSADLLFERLSDWQAAAFLDILETLAADPAPSDWSVSGPALSLGEPEP